MAWTTQDLANIDSAIAQGAQEVRYGERVVTYRSIDDLLKARSEIATYIAQQSALPVRQIRAYTDKGWGS